MTTERCDFTAVHDTAVDRRGIKLCHLERKKNFTAFCSLPFHPEVFLDQMMLRVVCSTGISQLRRLQSTASVNASQAVKSTVREAVPPQAAPPTVFQRVKGILWTTEGIVVASVGAGAYAAYFISGWEPSGRQMPDSAHYEYKVDEAKASEKEITKDSKDHADLSSFKEKTDAVFKDFKP